jgi:spore germination protein YaaH
VKWKAAISSGTRICTRGCPLTYSFLLFFLGIPLADAQPKALFYMIDSANSVKSFADHADKIDTLVPTWYRIDGDGLMWGAANPFVLQTAAQHHVPVMPIVASMQQAELHKLFTTPAARKAFIGAMVTDCRKEGYSGFQLDFENVLWTDRDLLSDLVAEAAVALHKEGFQLTIATVPNGPGAPGNGAYSHWLYANWRGAYDLQTLAKSADLICLMTYDQNTRWTAPGPVAGYPWTVQQLKYALQFVPKQKLSLGIPVYGYHWFAGEPTKVAGEPGKDERPNPTAEYVGQPEIDQFINSYHPPIEWDATDRVAWFYFYQDDTREWVFFTDKRGFKERLNLVQEYGLQGFCSWVLGAEDPSIWDLLPSHK